MKRRRDTGEFDPDRFRGRARLIVASLALIACALLARAVHLQVPDQEFLAQEGDKR